MLAAPGGKHLELHFGFNALSREGRHFPNLGQSCSSRVSLVPVWGRSSSYLTKLKYSLAEKDKLCITLVLEEY